MNEKLYMISSYVTIIVYFITLVMINTVVILADIITKAFSFTRKTFYWIINKINRR